MKEDFQTDLSGYFSSHILFYAFLTLCAGLWFLFDNELIGGLFLISAGTLFYAARYGLQVNFGNKTYRKYGQILGLKFGEQNSFGSIDYLYINSGRVSQTMNYKSLRTTINDKEYSGYIKFDGESKLHLLTSKNKNRIVKKLRMIASALNSKIVDYSDGEPKEI